MSNKDSHLPVWLLDMRKKLSDSREAHAATEARIVGLNTGMKELNDHLAAVVPIVNRDDEKVKQANKFKWLHFLYLPPDMLCYILGYIKTREVLYLEMTNSNMPSIIQSSNFWFVSYSDEYPNFAQSESKNFRDFIVTKLRYTLNSLRFIQCMKDQRSVPRFRSVQPHRYSCSEKSISHPMPVFEQTGNTRMMSRAETMGNKDFRSFALTSLYIMNMITCNELDPVHNELHEHGVVTVLMSLLSNESGVLQQLACEILANLLCAEWRRSVNCDWIVTKHGSGGGSSNSNVFAGGSSPVCFRVGGHKMSIADQLQACDGRRQLLGLLTSPSASVNLAQSRSRAFAAEPYKSKTQLQQQHGPGQHHVSGTDAVAAPAPVGLGDDVSSTGTMHIRTTSSVQGMACRSASRTLVNLFSHMCVPSPVREKALRGDMKFECNGTRLKRASSCEEAPMHRQRESPTPKHSSRDELLSIGAVSASFPFPSLAMGCRVSAKPWQMSYYHKSGYLKDTHMVYLQFSEDGQTMRGRGCDCIGAFFMKGRADLDIEGFSWHVDKCYLNLASQDIQDSSPSGLEQWARNEDGEWVSDSVLASWGRSHVQHTGYISGGVGEVFVTEACFLNHKRMGLAYGEKQFDGCGRDNALCETQVKRERELEEFRCFNSHWGSGMWGVWEGSTAGSHYELQKGGVFRAVPCFS